jgi:membrane protease YdiL (CAAX protease family)
MSSVPPPQQEIAPPPQPAAERPEGSWPLWVAPAGIVLGLGLGLVGAVFVDVIGAAAGSPSGHPTPAVNILSDVATDAGFVVAALYFAFTLGHRRPADFGYRRPRLQTTVVTLAVAIVAYYGLTSVYGSLLNLHAADKLPNELGINRSNVALAAVAAFVCVIAPIAEEFFFRGFLFGVLRSLRVRIAGRNVGTLLAALIVGILFGLAHAGSAPAEDLVPLGFLGFVLCLVRWRTGSLYPCMALHSANNVVSLGWASLHWSVGAIFALLAGSLLLISAITGPLALRTEAVGAPGRKLAARNASG